MSKPQRTSMSITIERKLLLERCAIDATNKLGRTVKWTDLANYLIDNFAKGAAEDLVESEKEK